MKPHALGFTATLVVALILPMGTQADWADRLSGVLPGSDTRALEAGQIEGLKDLLNVSSDQAVSTVGKSGGSLENPGIKIP